MVRISVGSPTHHTSGRLYGVFFEDINHGADGGLNANMVNNYSFDGVYLDHHTWRAAGSDRWRTQADPLRFWDFTNCSAVSYGTEIRGAHGQRMTTDCPEPPVHANSRYVRITAPRPLWLHHRDHGRLVSIRHQSQRENHRLRQIAHHRGIQQ